MVAPKFLFCLALLLPATISRAADTTNSPSLDPTNFVSTNVLGSLAWAREISAREGDRPIVALGIKYLTGDGVPIDEKKAVSLFTMAAGGGDPEGEFDLGAVFEQGRGVPKDSAKAMDWLKLSAIDGHGPALARIAGIRWNEAQTDSEKLKASAFMRRVAAAGFPPAQGDLGVEYQEGPASMRDLVESAKWLQLAADGGLTDATARRDEIMSLLSPAQKTEALRRVKEFKSQSSDDPVVLDDPPPITVPMGEYFRIPVRAFDATRYVLLDTGTTFAAFGTRFKRALGPSLSVIDIATTSTNVDWEQFDCPAIFIGDQRFAPLLAVMTDIGKFQRQMGEPLAGAIGMSCMKDRVVCFDSDKRLITLGGTVPESLKKNGEVVPLQKRAGSYGVKALINGKGPIFLEIDTGFNAFLDLNDSDFKIAFPGKPPAFRDDPSLSAEGSIVAGKAFRVKTLKVGSLTSTGIVAGTQRNSTVGSRVGQLFIKRFLWTMDFPNGKLYLQPGQDFGLPFDMDMSGMALEKHGKNVIIAEVDADSPAYIAGVRDRDVLLNFNGEDVASLSLADIRRTLRKKPRDEIQLKVKRGQQTLAFTFRLKRLL